MAHAQPPVLSRQIHSFTKEQLDRCIEVYQPLYDEPLNHDSAAEILHNVTAVFRLLTTWARCEDQLTTSDSSPSSGEE